MAKAVYSMLNPLTSALNSPSFEIAGSLLRRLIVVDISCPFTGFLLQTLDESGLRAEVEETLGAIFFSARYGRTENLRKVIVCLHANLT